MLRLLYRAAVVSTFTRVVVTGSSMYPTLDSGEYVLFNRLAYVRRSPRRGDIVLVRRPLEKEKAIIKRVVGIPGDTVQFSQGVVTVNGVLLEETSYLEEMDSEKRGLWTLKHDECFLLGDAMDMSTDSRSYGPVPQKAIKARAWLVCWPLNRWRSLETE